MADLRDLRHSPAWQEIEQYEMEELRRLTPQEGIRRFARLYEEFAAQMEAAEPYVRQERLGYLCQLQERLSSLNRLR